MAFALGQKACRGAQSIMAESEFEGNSCCCGNRIKNGSTHRTWTVDPEGWPRLFIRNRVNSWQQVTAPPCFRENGTMKAATQKFCFSFLSFLLLVFLATPALADGDDPPSLVARVSYLSGNVSFEPSGE